MMLKIVYFDEKTAMDYLDIKFGGKLETMTEELDEKAKKALARIEAQAEAGLKFLQFFQAKLSSGGNAEASRQGIDIMKSTLTNTVLTDFIAITNTDGKSDIVIFEGFQLRAKKDSFAHIKMFTPYIAIIKNIENIDIGKLDEILETAKGYYELIAQKGDQKVILRFNIKAFRNNYGLTDLLKMNLKYYAFHVGKCSEEDLLMKNEMQDSGETKEIGYTEMLAGVETECNLDVYDVVLAGIGEKTHE